MFTCFFQRSAPKKLWQNSRYFNAKPTCKLQVPQSRTLLKTKASTTEMHHVPPQQKRGHGHHCSKASATQFTPSPTPSNPGVSFSFIPAVLKHLPWGPPRYLLCTQLGIVQGIGSLFRRIICTKWKPGPWDWVQKRSKTLPCRFPWLMQQTEPSAPS